MDIGTKRRKITRAPPDTHDLNRPESTALLVRDLDLEKLVLLADDLVGDEGDDRVRGDSEGLGDTALVQAEEALSLDCLPETCKSQ